MKVSAFIGYVGSPDLHDGFIRKITRRAGVVHVLVRCAKGQDYDVAFNGVRRVQENQAAGRTLYAISEMRGPSPIRKFIFDGWSEDGQAALEIDAEQFRISRVAPRA